MEDAANFIGPVQGEIGNVFEKVGRKFNSITIPKLELNFSTWKDKQYPGFPNHPRKRCLMLQKACWK
jgi:hypothetical protein